MRNECAPSSFTVQMNGRNRRRSRSSISRTALSGFRANAATFFGAIRAGGEELCRIRSGAQKWDIVKAAAHLSIVMMESYALKELSEAEMRRVEKHVARCPKCRDRLEGELGWSAAR